MRSRLDAVRDRIRVAAERAGRSPDEVTLVAVTKGVPVEQIRALAALGVADVGESRVQEALTKMASLEGIPIRWHLVGHLQRNKARRAADSFTLIHSVGSRVLAEALARHGEAHGQPAAVLLQVNVTAAPAQYGFIPRDLEREARAIVRLAGLRVEGLMTIGPLVGNPEEARPAFRRARELSQELRAVAPQARHLSMGMSDDFEVAVEEGATFIRVGRALFGERTAAP